MAGKSFLWVGNEIHTTGPYGFPTENEIVKFMTKEICGKETWERIEARIQDDNQIFGKMHKKAVYELHPEWMIRELSRMKGVSFMQEFKKLEKIPYNDNHRRIAKLVVNGMDIVTTNIDMCIENAYTAETGKRMQLKNERCGVSIYKDIENNSGTIYHIHGTVENPFEIGGRVRDGGKYFSSRFRKKLEYWMTHEYTAYVLGYPCWDFFDVSVYISERTRALAERVNWEIRYVSEVPRSEQLNRVRRFIQLFPKHHVLIRHKDAFLRGLLQERGCGDIVHERRPLQFAALTAATGEEEHQLHIDEEDHGPAFTWMSVLQSVCAQMRPFRDLYILMMNDVLGIPVDAMDPEILERVNRMPGPVQRLYKALLCYHRYRDMSVYDCPKQIPENLSQTEEVMCREMIYRLEDITDEDLTTLRHLQEEVTILSNEYVGVLRRKLERDAEVNRAMDYLLDVNDYIPEENEAPKNKCNKYILVYSIRAALLAIISEDEEDFEKVSETLDKVFLFVSQAASLTSMSSALSLSWFCYINFFYKTGKKAYYDRAGKIKKYEKKLLRP